MAPSSDVPREGEVVGGQYLLREIIGEGGMGVVFLADHLSRGRKVAIKILHPALASSAALVRRFRTEAIAASRVEHPGAVSVIDYGATDAGVPFIVMEHVQGRPLTTVAREALSIYRAVEIVRRLLEALAATHERGVVHADIKSDNIILEDTPGDDAPVLIDFGLARIAGRRSHVEDDGSIISGTPEYMAPELVRGESPTIATDLYGIGVILYKLLTGRTPFEGGSTNLILLRQLEDEPIAPSVRRPDRGITPELDRIVLRALHKDPAQRFASAGELGRALAAVSRARRASEAGTPVKRLGVVLPLASGRAIAKAS